MTIRPVFLVLALLATTSLVTGCSKAEQKAEAPKSIAAEAPPPAPAVEPLASDTAPADSKVVPADAAPVSADREAELELRAAAAEARARLAEIELRDQTTRALLHQQHMTQIEAERAAQLAAQTRALDAENAALRVRALESEQRAVEAERAAYGAVNSVIVVQPPQRGGYYGRPPLPNLPSPSEPPPKGVGTVNVGLGRPAVPNLTPPGAPASLPPPRTESTDDPQFDTMRARKPRASRDVP